MIRTFYLVLDDFRGRIGSAWRGMGYLKLLILVLAYALISPALAQTCCPAGCAPEADQCVNALTGSAQFRGCFFEDDAGRAEDKRTGLSCPDRQAALAKQCLKRCANYASDTTHLVCTGSYPNTVWHISFGDISGDTGDSARVDLCGPPLRSIFAKKPPPG